MEHGSQHESQQARVANIDMAIEHFIDELSGDKVKLSVSDVIRLLDLRKELAHHELREVRVQWVESNPDPSAISS